jgi:hypothetical protein
MFLFGGCLEPEHHVPDEEPTFECGHDALYARTHDECAPMSAAGEGACRCVLGYIWDGSECTMLGGCECVGADCDALTESYEECMGNHEACGDVDDSPVFECGSEALFERDHERCDPMDAAGRGSCRCALGYVWDGADCTMVGGCECAGTDCDSMSETYEECIANHEECIDEPPADPCEAMDAVGDGLCRAILGYAFDGRECVMLGGCDCLGGDCDDLFESEEACEAAYRECIEIDDPVEPELTPCGDDFCDAATEICRESIGWTTYYDCVPVPEDCIDDRSCECERERVCDSGCDLCIDSPTPGANVITCECLCC